MALDIQQRKVEYGTRRHYPETEAGACRIRILLKDTAINGVITRGNRTQTAIGVDDRVSVPALSTVIAIREELQILLFI